MRAWWCLAPALAAVLAAEDGDTILRAMRDELKRSMTLKFENLEKPYYVEYSIDDARVFNATASVGGLISAAPSHFRAPAVHVRVGSYSFDNTNYVGSGFGGRNDMSPPLDDSYAVLRRYLWLATDTSYKSAVQAIARKRSALKNVTQSEVIPDFSEAKPIRLIEPLRTQPFDPDVWIARIKSLSAIPAKFPGLTNSLVEFQAIRNVHYMANRLELDERIPGDSKRPLHGDLRRRRGADAGERPVHSRAGERPGAGRYAHARFGGVSHARFRPPRLRR